MKFDEDHLIEKYLNQTLSKEALILFEERLAEDEAFFDKVQLEKQLFHTLNDEDWSLALSKNSKDVQAYRTLFDDEATEKVKTTITEGYNLYKKENRLKKTRWFVYASAAILVVCISLFSLIQPQQTHVQLYATYIDFSELPTVSTRGEDRLEKLLEAEQLFESKEYAKVVALLKDKLHTAPQQASLYLYLGISYVELEQFEEANNVFNALNKTDLIDGRMSTWYMALLYVKKNDLHNAKTLLQEIVSKKLYNHEKANDLLQALD